MTATNGWKLAWKCTAAFLAMTPAGHACGQAADDAANRPAEEAATDDVVATGTLIRGAETPTGAASLTVDTKAIEATGATAVVDVRNQTIPQLRTFSSLAVGTAGIALSAEQPRGANQVPAPAEPASHADDPLHASFRQPPVASRPQVWWHWMGGNLSSEGVDLDLAWMERIGIGGVHIFSGSLPGPQVVDPPITFMGQEWRRLFDRAVRTARAGGMEVTIAGSPGWSQTGGPWVPAADAMKKYVWSETALIGGRPFRGMLATPPTNSGPFLAARERAGSAVPVEVNHYRDTFVVAFPTPAAERSAPAPTYTSNAGTIDLAALKPDLSTSLSLPLDMATRKGWVQMEFERPTRVSALSLGITEPLGVGVEVLASSDGTTFRRLLQTEPAPVATIDLPLPQRTYAFEPVTAKFFRVVLTAPPAAPRLPGMPSSFPSAPPADHIMVSRMELETVARVDDFEAKAGFQTFVPSGDGPYRADAEDVIDPAEVIDLTDRMDAEGRLDWTPPPGHWTVLRFGWTLTGHRNGPAEPEATGLEVDKLDPDAVRRYLDSYLSLYAEATGGKLGPQGVQWMLTDSWEAGAQNWTPRLTEEFRERRGYSPLPYLPVLSGRVVRSIDASERFLWDFRQTLKQLVADNHHGVIAGELHRRGMGYYSEAQGDNPRAIADGLALKARADIPTAEYWFREFAAGPGQLSLKADLEEAASAAHLYGKPLAAAEALTVAAGDDPWSFSPAMLKPVADEIFARGINRILIHESHLQPYADRKPGLAMFIFGQFFNRNDTWAEDAGPWVDYLARTSHMLQQGRYVADIAYFYGEERNLTELFRDRLNTDVPSEYRYDYVNSEALLSLLSVQEGRISTPTGMTYRVLYMPEHVTRYSLGALRKVRDLVAAGAIVVGPKPVGGLGLGSPDADIMRLTDEVWGPGAGNPEGRPFGKGRVYATADLSGPLAAEKVSPDVKLSVGTEGESEILWLHRRTDDSDIYFLSNQSGEAVSLSASFRVAGKRPELWRAETGSVQPVSYRVNDGRVATELSFAADDAFFIVFRRDAEQEEWNAPEAREETLATLQGPWPVHFEPGRGAPRDAILPTLISWPEATEEGIRYFSGSATYDATVDIASEWLRSGRRIELDLGVVHEMAAVTVNGTPVGTAWHAPYRLDLAPALKAGRNSIEIRVVNLWPNRLIGDKQPGVEPVAFAPQSSYRADSRLLPSGLLGPVRLVSVTDDP